jgi:hypothetical protein
MIVRLERIVGDEDPTAGLTSTSICTPMGTR